jgi:hypothetical protein
MSEQHGHGSDGPSESELQESIAAGYERQDISLSVLIRWGVGLGIFLTATAGAALILFTLLQRPPFGPPVVGQTMLQTQSRVPPPGTPIVQDNPFGDPRPDNNPRKGIDNIREYRREEEIRMRQYSTQDGEIHIPIDRAMELTVSEVPVQKPGEAPTGVSPTPEMKIHPAPVGQSAPGSNGAAAPSPARPDGGE